MSAALPSPNRQPEPSDIIVTGHVVTMDPGRLILRDGAVAIRDGMIVAVGTRVDVLASHTGKRMITASDQIIMPAFSDCHTHSTQSLVRGLIAGELPMIYRLYIPADMALTPEEAYLGARLCATQLALSGVTTVCDFAGDTTPEHEDAIIAGTLEAGMRLVFCRGNGDQDHHHAALYSQIGDRSSMRTIEGRAEQDLLRTEALLNRAAEDRSGRFHAAVAPQNLLGFSEAYFAQAHALAKSHRAGFQVHAARDREEVEFCLAVFGRRPIERLIDLGVVDDRLVCVHAILATAVEILELGRAGASVAHSAVELVNILAAIPSVARMRAAGISVGLGCDNAVNDIWKVMHCCWTMQTGVHGIAAYEPDGVSEDDVFGCATIEAARLLGLQSSIGSIEVGKSADLVVLDGGKAHLMPLQAVPTDLVRFGGRDCVRHVMCAGRLVVEDFRHALVDLEALHHAITPIGAKLRDVVTVRRYRPLRGCCG